MKTENKLPNLSEEEAKELFEKESDDLKIAFSSYYKYNFSFSGETENFTICCATGCQGSDDIYKYSVDTTPIKVPKTIEELKEDYKYVYIIEKSTGRKYTYENYY